MKARELGRAGVIVGDRVALVGDVTGDPGTLARIVRVEDRTSLLRRSADDAGDGADPVERPIVANADQLAVVTALADPEPRPRLVDRALVAAYDAGLDPLLVLTKADLTDPGAVPGRVRPARRAVRGDPPGPGRAGDDRGPGRRPRAARRPGDGAGRALRRRQVDAGQRPGPGRRAGHRRRQRRHRPGPAHVVVRGGRCRCPRGGWVVDTPGVRSFGLGHVDPDRILAAFPDLAAGTGECPRGCTPRRAGVRARRVRRGGRGGARRRRRGWSHCAACCARAPAARSRPRHPARRRTNRAVRGATSPTLGS